MVLTTKDDILKRLPSRYRTQYGKSNRQLFNGKWTADIIEQLEAESPLTEERAIEITNKSWTDNICDECRQDVYATVQLGQEPDYESRTANICLDCLQKAIALFPPPKL